MSDKQFTDICSRPIEGNSAGTEDLWRKVLAQPCLKTIQIGLRHTHSFTSVELEYAKAAIAAAQLTDIQLTTLESVARGRATENRRRRGWDGGVWEIVEYIHKFRAERSAA